MLRLHGGVGRPEALTYQYYARFVSRLGPRPMRICSIQPISLTQQTAQPVLQVIIPLVPLRKNNNTTGRHKKTERLACGHPDASPAPALDARPEFPVPAPDARSVEASIPSRPMHHACPRPSHCTSRPI
jgi:hypothetical protein